MDQCQPDGIFQTQPHFALFGDLHVFFEILPPTRGFPSSGGSPYWSQYGPVSFCYPHTSMYDAKPGRPGAWAGKCRRRDRSTGCGDPGRCANPGCAQRGLFDFLPDQHVGLIVGIADVIVAAAARQQTRQNARPDSPQIRMNPARRLTICCSPALPEFPRLAAQIHLDGCENVTV